MEELFYCYSTTLMHFLKANGLRYKYETTHSRTGNRMWVFERDDVLRALLDEYDARKAQARVEGRLGESSGGLRPSIRGNEDYDGNIVISARDDYQRTDSGAERI